MSTPERAPGRYGYDFSDESDLDLDTPLVPISTGRTIVEPKERTIELEEVPVLKEESPNLTLLQESMRSYVD